MSATDATSHIINVVTALHPDCGLNSTQRMLYYDGIPLYDRPALERARRLGLVTGGVGQPWSLTEMGEAAVERRHGPGSGHPIDCLICYGMC